ncbi:unnamed protein product [Didymodactylos carnosus]|uniref:Uncharacterized protein n=1 Tax=Didymodactylos carnosus TaxID=1234261 RepID=A0A814N461_9BILA|nr:unnamed protein product [Didymodactylos carnosus]CAF3853818.1 unnamed protein product [Didymodactylos carnosus]
MTSDITASTPTGNGRRIPLLGTDLIFGGIDNVFVYPSLDINQLKQALCQTLSLWPMLTGRLLIDGDDYTIEMSDQSIPFVSTENDQLECWPTLPVIVNDAAVIQPFIDSVVCKPDEPLLLFCHMIGDAAANIHFLSDWSRLYQHLEPESIRPIFERERNMWKKENDEFHLSPSMKLIRNGDKRESILARLVQEYSETESINIPFSSAQLAKLQSLVNENNSKTMLTSQDALNAYIIRTLNKHILNNVDDYIRRAYILINFRGISDRLAPAGRVANSLMQMLTDDFSDPLSLKAIAQAIRQTIQETRHESFLEQWLPTADRMMNEITKEGRVNFVWDKNEVVFNSNFKYDWTDRFDLGMNNQCRLHTLGTYKAYFRIFRLNPVRNENGDWTKDIGGAEVAFRIPKDWKNKFLDAWKKDVEENFVNIE